MGFTSGEQLSGSSLVAQLVKNLPAVQIPSSNSGSGRSLGEGIGYLLQYSWASLVAQTVKNPPAVWDTWVRSLGWEDPLEEGMATHSSILAWRIPREEPGGLQPMESQRVRHHWATKHSSWVSRAPSSLPPFFYFTSPWATGHHVHLNNPGGQESRSNCSKGRDSTGNQQGHYPLMNSITGIPCSILCRVAGSFLFTNLTKGCLWACLTAAQL